MGSFTSSPRVVRVLLMVLAAAAFAATVLGHFFSGLATARADGKNRANRFVTGTVTAKAATPIFTFAQVTPKLKVVASTSDLAALAAEVGGDRVEVESIVRSNQDPHFVESKPSYLLKVRQADLLIVVGLQLEADWLTRGVHRTPLISESGNPRIQPGASGYFDASQYAEILGTPSQPRIPDIQH
jgi:ABC-type Zn uptake system ZnuABC Zn-binding protein ZnuA